MGAAGDTAVRGSLLSFFFPTAGLWVFDSSWGDDFLRNKSDEILYCWALF